PVRAAGDEIDQLALEAVRVLELVDHDRAEAQLLALADVGVVAEQVPGGELEVLEVERRLALLRGGVRGGEAVEELLEQVAVGGREGVEGSVLDAAPRLLVRGGAVAGCAVLGEVEQPARAGVGGEQL